MYRKGRGTTSGTVKNGGRRRKSITRRKKENNENHPERNGR
jgi:hypothetical protein